MVLTAFFLQLLMVGATASPLADATNPMGDASKMNTDLVERLDEVDDAAVLPVIFQLHSPVTSNDLAFMRNLGLDVLGDAPRIDGGLVEGKAIDVRRMSTWDRVEYLELDKPLEFFYLPSDWGGQPDPGIMMHETTHIVGATDAWDRVIVAPSGEILREVDLSFSEWDGDGTAIVDLDTGVDAGHPDYDYLEPWTGEKTLYSAKWTPADNEWVETRNSDTSSGHGTHVGGTIAGNGDASAGRRAGVAKGGQLIALGAGDGASIFAGVQGLEWTYAHSIPGQNPHHIRVVSNSWGSDGDYNPEGAIAQLTDQLTYDNGVAVIFAASNSGGSGAECSGGLRTNVYANTPSAISVAALTHDGTAVTSFSSRGCMNQQHTWPDVGAPGQTSGPPPREARPSTPPRERKVTSTTCPSRARPWPRRTWAAWQASCSTWPPRWAWRTITGTTTTSVTAWLAAKGRPLTASSRTGTRATTAECTKWNSSSS